MKGQMIIIMAEDANGPPSAVSIKIVQKIHVKILGNRYSIF